MNAPGISHDLIIRCLTRDRGAVEKYLTYPGKWLRKEHRTLYPPLERYLVEGVKRGDRTLLVQKLRSAKIPFTIQTQSPIDTAERRWISVGEITRSQVFLNGFPVARYDVGNQSIIGQDIDEIKAFVHLDEIFEEEARKAMEESRVSNQG